VTAAAAAAVATAVGTAVAAVAGEVALDARPAEAAEASEVTLGTGTDVVAEGSADIKRGSAAAADDAEAGSVAGEPAIAAEASSVAGRPPAAAEAGKDITAVGAVEAAVVGREVPWKPAAGAGEVAMAAGPAVAPGPTAL